MPCRTHFSASAGSCTTRRRQTLSAQRALCAQISSAPAVPHFTDQEEHTPAPFVDELTPIAKYMAAEMIRNPRSTIGRQIRVLNAGTATCLKEFYVGAPLWQRMLQEPTHCIPKGIADRIKAMELWYRQVTYDADWDHKPKIRNRPDFWSRTGDREKHIYGDTAYGFDVWSNIHYGYVGLAVGFDRSTLLDGAGAAQFKKDFEGAFDWPEHTGPWILPRSWDRPEDRVSITLGFELYRRMPTQMIPEVLVREIVRAKGILKEPANLSVMSQTFPLNPQ
jgi:hypothetical protein